MTLGTLDRKNAMRLAAGVAVILFLRFVVMADRNQAVVVSGPCRPPRSASSGCGRSRRRARRETLLKRSGELDARERHRKVRPAPRRRRSLRNCCATGAANRIDIAAWKTGGSSRWPAITAKYR